LARFLGKFAQAIERIPLKSNRLECHKRDFISLQSQAWAESTGYRLVGAVHANVSDPHRIDSRTPMFMLRHDAYTKFVYRNDILQVPSALNATGVEALST
jgi:hypothetical protein